MTPYILIFKFKTQRKKLTYLQLDTIIITSNQKNI